MPGDYSRKIFDPKKHYSGVLMQQGRVQLDADWNEQLDIQLHRTRTETIDVIGQSGAQKQTGGFSISLTADGSDILISQGHMYVGGLLCELESSTPPVSYLNQPYLPNPDPSFFVPRAPSSPVNSPPSSPVGSVSNLADGTYIAYLEAWQREINFHDDPRIQEVAIGEADTTTRLKTIWQVKLLKITSLTGPNAACSTPFPEWTNLIAPTTGMLNAKTTQPLNTDQTPCTIPPGSSYRSLENQLYRIEIQNGGTLSQATFKWSRDNASVETVIQVVNGSVLTVADTGKDDVLGFALGQWVEIVSEAGVLNGQPNKLVQIVNVEDGPRKITVNTDLSQFKGAANLKLRRWDQSGASANENGLAMTSGWMDVEEGIQDIFSAGTYKAGDYWLIPARTATGEIEWPPYQVPNLTPQAQPPAGTTHYFSRLALINSLGGNATITDCRPLFPSLTNITAQDVGFNGGSCKLIAATTVQQALDMLCRSSQGA